MNGSGRAASFALGALAGALALGGARMAAMPPEQPVHYHANWLVVLDGERLDLSDARYMEDVAACRLHAGQVTAEERVHLHDGVADAVHVHAAGATWGHLLANLGFGLGRDYLVTDAGRRLASDSARTLKFVLNGRPMDEVHNRVIASGDRLLVSYGPETADAVARTQFPQVPATAERLNTQPDPASCSGPQPPTFGERVRRAFWF